LLIIAGVNDLFGKFLVTSFLILLEAGGIQVGVRLSYEVTLQVIDVAFKVHQVFLVFSVDLDASQALGGELLGVIDVYHIIILFALILLGSHLLLLSIGSQAVFFIGVFKACRHLSQSILAVLKKLLLRGTQA
jgi:hypothetical protein